MGVEQYELLKESMDEIVTVAAKYHQHLQPAVVDSLSAALIANSNSVSSSQPQVVQEDDATKSDSVKNSSNDVDWDFRSALLNLNASYDLSSKQFTNTEFPALLAFVVQRHAPNELKKQPVTAKHLQDGCRTVDRKIPANPANTLSKASTNGLLDKVKGQSGYTLTPKGENRVNEILAEQASHDRPV